MGVRYQIRDMYQFFKRTHSVSGRPTWMHVVITSTGGFFFLSETLCVYHKLACTGNDVRSRISTGAGSKRIRTPKLCG